MTTCLGEALPHFTPALEFPSDIVLQSPGRCIALLHACTIVPRQLCDNMGKLSNVLYNEAQWLPGISE